MVRLEIVEGDITKMKVDAIVNAANSALCGGGGVDGAIHRAAGPKLLEACRSLGRCPVGMAKITPAFLLPASYVIHAVGPVWSGGHKNERALLASCYLEILRLANEHELASIAFPAISCGAYRFPIEEAAQIALETIVAFCEKDTRLSQIFMVCFEPKIFRVLNKAYQTISP